MASTYRPLFEKAFALQRLTDLFEERIKDSKTIGRDGVRASEFEKTLQNGIQLIIGKVGRQTYRFTRYKEKLISKGPEKAPRVLSIPTVRDRLTLRALCEFLAATYEDVALAKPHSYIKSIRTKLAEVPDDFVFIRLDIQNYYGAINKKLLMRTIRRRVRIPQAIHLISAAIHTPTIAKDKEEEGIPQGLSISNILAAVYLADCDRMMKLKWNYYRYVDDILVLCKDSEVQEVLGVLGRVFRRKRLKHHPLDPNSQSKSYIATKQQGVEYLGFKIRPGGVSVRTSSYRKMFQTIGSVLTEFKFKKREDRLVWRLNLKISGCTFEGKNYGWMFFFLQTDDMKQLSRLDHFVYQQLKKRKLGHLRQRIKRFIRSYHEIRYNLADTKYVPNFDKYSIEDMKMAIHQIKGTQIIELNGMSDEEITNRFFAAVKKEIGDLEKDLIEAFS